MKAASRSPIAVIAMLSVLLVSPVLLRAQQKVDRAPGSIRIVLPAGVLHVEVLRKNIVWVDVRPNGRTSPRTLMLDPKLSNKPASDVAGSETADTLAMQTPSIRVTVDRTAPYSITVFGAGGRELVSQRDPLDDAKYRNANFLHLPGENLYGMSGLSRRNNGGRLLRNNGSAIAAGSQGNAGGPWFFTTRYGVLVDSNGGAFDTRDDRAMFSGNSRSELEYFVIAGRPLSVMSGLAALTGKPPLPPEWTLGFLNSQWGINEAKAIRIVDTYRAKHIPLDGLIFDFDWKAWGEDNYGEWRWNSTSTPESASPDKFPDGASGKFAREMAAKGVKLSGILKPRILLYKKGTHILHAAAAYAQEHNLWYPGEPQIIDYVTHEPARDLDFSKAATRTWYWKHLEPAFHAGMVGWWNDEADVTDVPGGVFHFGNLQFMNMGRMLYNGQRSVSNLRVWSLNRNFYVGAQRYGYAEWSGDIQTGFQSMGHQRPRMLATLDMGEPWWSMDTGGFFGHPDPENYARWMEFAAFVPIDRVHGYLGQKRQPWRYGPVAEAAAVRAIRLRYRLLPYIYSYAHVAAETGVGIVRPLFWMYPGDPKTANDTSAWMFGDALLVSPVVKPGETEHVVYLPAGVWFDYFRGTRYQGGQTIRYAVNPHTWQDIPLFVRAGSILATRSVQDYVGQSPAKQIRLDVFPDSRPCQFVYYDDDGTTYAYEHGVDYRQTIRAWRSGSSVQVVIDKAQGSFHPPLRSYLVRVHGIAADAVTLNGAELSQAHGAAIPAGQWGTGRDRFGVWTAIRVRPDQASGIVLRTGGRQEAGR
jgi:alpha-glucosidase